jgi:hypothetical protein
MRYYEARYPEVDELVMVQVRQIAEMGAYVKLVRRVLLFQNSLLTRACDGTQNIWTNYSSSTTISRG